MRTITKKVKLFKYEELEDSAKEYALQKFREYAIEPSMITEQFAYDLEELGYPTDDIRWSLSYCQGDGMAFYGRIDREGLVKIAERLMPNRWLLKLINAGCITAKINCVNSHYNHWNSMQAEVEIDGYYHNGKRIEKLVVAFEKAMDAECTQISKRLEADGYAEIEYQESEEQLIESAEANDWEFTEDGKIYR